MTKSIDFCLIYAIIEIVVSGCDNLKGEKMFKKNAKVIYSVHSICSITDIVMRTFGEQTQKYYELRPLYNARSTVFVPVDNPVVSARLFPVLSKAEVLAVIDRLPKEKCVWQENAALRKDYYTAALAADDRLEWLKLIHAIREHMREAELTHSKKLYATDERALRDAQRLIYDEFAYVLGIERNDVDRFITERVQKKKSAACKT